MKWKTLKKPYHFYACTMDTWVIGEDIVETISKLKNNSSRKMLFILKVPLPMNAAYKISFYIPLVDNIEFIDGDEEMFKACNINNK